MTVKLSFFSQYEKSCYFCSVKDPKTYNNSTTMFGQGVFLNTFFQKNHLYKFPKVQTESNDSACLYCCSFTGKEKDSETGFYYFGARYYDPALSGLFICVDPMADKYPSISPYAYCAWNPVKLVDPDGEKIVAYNKKTEACINKYMSQLFGSSDLFYFNKNGVLKRNKSEFKNYYNNIATDDQKILLNGLKKCIKISKKATIIVQENNNKFKLYGRDDTYECDPEIVLEKGSGATSNDEFPGLGHIIYINDRGDNNTGFLSSGTDSYGNSKKVQAPVSTAFIHELLDEFYNTIVTGKISEESPGIDKVQNQNVALRILGKDERDGTDHNY